jgi:hypothetical protein
VPGFASREHQRRRRFRRRRNGEGVCALAALSPPGDPDGPLARFARRKIIYADPMDITKMLDVTPGTQVLNGVRDTMQLLYPPTER